MRHSYGPARRLANICPPFGLLGLFSLALLGGCRAKQVIKAPSPVRLDMPEPKVTDGSLWQGEANAFGLISDATGKRKGDLVTILIVEDTNAKRDRKTKTSRTSEMDAGFNQIFYPNWFQYHGYKPRIKFDNKRAFDGGGSIEEKGTVRAKISAQITEVLPNGNLVVLGQKEVIVSEESQVITLTGLVRPQDVRPDNTVLSTDIAEARINIYGNGPLDDAQRRSLLGKAVDWLNLF